MSSASAAVEHFIELADFLLDPQAPTENLALLGYALGVIHGAMSAWCGEAEQARMQGFLRDRVKDCADALREREQR